MFSERIRRFVETVDQGIVASADDEGAPHLAGGEGILAPDEQHLVFTSWCCVKTLENVSSNPRVAVVVMAPGERTGYQLEGTVEGIERGSILDAYAPTVQKVPHPQVLSRLVIRINGVMEFSTGLHSDAGLGEIM